MNWIKCESKKARLLKGHRVGGGRWLWGKVYANVCTVPAPVVDQTVILKTHCNNCILREG